MDGLCEQLVGAVPCTATASSTPRPVTTPRVVIHLPVVPGATMSWRVAADTELQAAEARVWVTRLFSPYDHWLRPGDVLRLTRGERIWISTDAVNGAALTLTSAWVSEPRGALAWIDRLRDFLKDAAMLRARQ